MKNVFLNAASALLLLAWNSAGAAVYDAPKPGNDVIGNLEQTTADERDTLVALGRKYNLGYREMRLANPDIDPWLPGAGSHIVLPSLFVLPDTPREGIVLNLAEMRLYFFPPESSEYAGKIITYPLGVGREGWGTPLGTTSIVRTNANPTWTPPESIKKEHAENGDPLPDVVPAGPDNPLGQFALYLGFPTYLIHGTNKPGGIGLRVSHGCIRLYPEDIAALFSMVERGTPVHIVDQPFKAGWLGDKLLLEVHPPDGAGRKPVSSYTPFVQRIIAATQSSPDTAVDWDKAEAVGTAANGMPEVVAIRKATEKIPQEDKPADKPETKPETSAREPSREAESDAPQNEVKKTQAAQKAPESALQAEPEEPAQEVQAKKVKVAKNSEKNAEKQAQKEQRSSGFVR